MGWGLREREVRQQGLEAGRVRVVLRGCSPPAAAPWGARVCAQPPTHPTTGTLPSPSPHGAVQPRPPALWSPSVCTSWAPDQACALAQALWGTAASPGLGLRRPRPAPPETSGASALEPRVRWPWPAELAEPGHLLHASFGLKAKPLPKSLGAHRVAGASQIHACSADSCHPEPWAFQDHSLHHSKMSRPEQASQVTASCCPKK